MEKIYTEKPTKRSIAVEIIMFLAYAFFAVNWIAGSTLTPEILETYRVEGPNAVSLITNVVTLAKIIGNLVAASIFAKLLPKKAISLASLFIPAGSLLAALAPNFPLFLIGRFVMGFGGALFVVYFSPVVMNYFAPYNRPLVNAFNNVAYNVGGIIALLIVKPVFAMIGHSRGTLIFFSIISFIIFALWVFIGEDFEIRQKQTGAKEFTLKDGFKDKMGILMPTMYFGHLTLYMVMLNIFPNTNFLTIPANRVSTYFTIGAMVGTLISVVVAKKIPKRVPVLKVGGILVTLLGLGLINAKSPVLVTILALALGTMMYVPLTNFVLIVQELPGMYPERLTQIMSVFWSMVYTLETIAYQIIVQIQYRFGDKTALTATVILSATFIVGSFFMPEPSEMENNK